MVYRFSTMNEFNGMTFRKADLHVHTPRSLCYREASIRPDQIVDAALSAGLDILGITDHNSFEGIDDVRDVACEKGLLVFPGVELSTRGGHVIALFDADARTSDLRDFIGAIGLSEPAWGDASIMAVSSLEEVFQKVHEWGGISIAAHIERWPSGFLETSLPRREKLRIHANRYLSALEITVSQNKTLWNAGQVRDYPRKLACVQGSDAHAPDEIGRRPVYIRMEGASLRGLRTAFVEHDTCIVFPDAAVPAP
jgi:predicted metal-dependent phosphoesterase TrpH